MHKAQEQVRDFHRACGLPLGQPISERPLDPADWETDEVKLRYELIREEVAELLEGIQNGNLVEIVDALCDLLYQTYGFSVAFGIDIEPFWEEIHRTNMMKASGPKREDGKPLKPDGWKPPVIGAMLKEMYAFYGIQVNRGETSEDSTNQSDLQSRVLSIVKDTPGPSSFVPGSEVHGLLQEPES